MLRPASRLAAARPRASPPAVRSGRAPRPPGTAGRSRRTSRDRDNVSRKARNGRGLLPPNPNQWLLEHNGLDLREALGMPLDVFLPHQLAFDLVPNARVLPHGDLPLAQTYIDHFRRNGSASWSGMGIPMPDGQVWVLYNDSHTQARIRATPMEEFFHL